MENKSSIGKEKDICKPKLSLSNSLLARRHGKPHKNGSNPTHPISDEEKAVDYVRRAFQYARSLLEASLDPLVTISKEGKITDANQATIISTGLPKEMLIGTDFSDYFTEPGKARQGYEEVFKKGFVSDYPLTLRNRSGQLLDVLYNASVYRDTKGEVAGVFAAARDVTRTKEASRYARSLLEASPDPLVTISKEGKITDVNEAAVKATGIAREKLIGTDFCNYFTEPQKARKGYQEVFRNGFVADYPLTIRHKNGKLVDVLYNATLYRDARGNVLGVFAAARDVSLLRANEQQLRAANQQLRASEQQLKAANQQLRASEMATKQASRYARSLLEASLDPLVTISKEGKITDVNEAAVKATGFAREKLVGTDFSNYFTEPKKARAGYEEVFKKGFVSGYPLTLRHKSGHTIEVVYNASIYKDADGKVLGVFAAARDVTLLRANEQQLRAANQQLRASEQQLKAINQQLRASEIGTRQASEYARSLVEASLDPLVTISKEGKITDVNEATIRATGFAREKLIGTDFSDYFTEPKKAREGYEEVFNKGFVSDYALTLRHKSGNLTDVLYNASVYRDAKGNVRGVFAAARNITKRKKAEAELTKYRDHLEQLIEMRSREIKESEEKYRTLFANMTEEVHLWKLVRDEKGRIKTWSLVDANPPTLKTWGKRLEDIMGKTTDEIFGPGASEHFMPVVEKITAEGTSHAYEDYFPHLDRHFRFTSVPFGDYFITTGADITTLKKSQETLINQAHDLEQFAYVAAHDLLEPLRTIASFGQLLESAHAGSLDEEAVRYIHMMVDGVQRMRHLVGGLLSYSRAGRSDVKMEPLNSKQLVEQVLNDLQGAIKEKEATVEIGQLPPVNGDSTQLAQLFLNLLSNALKFSEKGVRISISSESTAGHTTFRIKDNGIGIDKAHLNIIFEPFKRLHSRDKYAGSGIGLAIARKIVERHSGRIWVNSSVGKGTTFYFTIQENRGRAKSSELALNSALTV